MDSERRLQNYLAALGLLLVTGLLIVMTGCRIRPEPEPVLQPIFFPPPPAQPRIQYLRSFSTKEGIVKRKYAWIDILIGYSEPEIQIYRKPYGIAVTRGKFYVCDTWLGSVWVVDFEQGRIDRLAGDARLGKLRKPINITIDEGGQKYITDVEREQVVVYGPDDKYLRAFGAPLELVINREVDAEGRPVPVFQPGDVEIIGPRLYVSDLVHNEIQVRDKSTGKILRTFGSPESAPIEQALGQPVNLTKDSRGNLVISNTGRFRICRYSPEGEFLSEFGAQGRRPGYFARPKGIALDREDRIYVADAAFENVQIFDEAQKLLMWFGGARSDEAAMELPAQVVIDYENLDYFRKYVAPGYDLEYVIWVTNQFGNRGVSCYGFIVPAAEIPAGSE